MTSAAHVSFGHGHLPHQIVGLCVFEPRYHQMLSDIEPSSASAPV